MHTAENVEPKWRLWELTSDETAELADKYRMPADPRCRKSDMHERMHAVADFCALLRAKYPGAKLIRIRRDGTLTTDDGDGHGSAVVGTVTLSPKESLKVTIEWLRLQGATSWTRAWFNDLPPSDLETLRKKHGETGEETPVATGAMSAFFTRCVTAALCDFSTELCGMLHGDGPRDVRPVKRRREVPPTPREIAEKVRPVFPGERTMAIAGDGDSLILLPEPQASGRVVVAKILLGAHQGVKVQPELLKEVLPSATEWGLECKIALRLIARPAHEGYVCGKTFCSITNMIATMHTRAVVQALLAKCDGLRAIMDQ